MILATVPSDAFAATALGLGIAALVACACILPRRWALAPLVLWAGLLALVAAGALGLGDTSDADRAWSGKIGFAATVALVLAAVLLTVEARGRERALRRAATESETLRRDVDRLNGINVKLEDEARALRVKARDVEATQAGTGAVAEQTVARLRASLETANTALRRQRSLFEGAIEGMAILERETLRMTEVNPALEQVTGYTAEELGKLTVLDLLADAAGKPGKADLQRSARDRRAIDVVLLRKDREQVSVELTISVVGKDEEARLLLSVRVGTAHGAAEIDRRAGVASLRERVRLLEAAHEEAAERVTELEKDNRRLLETSERKDQYVSSVSHELRTPLTSIRSFAEILLKHDDADAAVHDEFVGIIHKESERLTRLVNNVLDLARIEAGATKLLLSEFDARVVAADAVAAMQGTARERKISLASELGEDERPVRADRDRLQQVLMNLVGNAIKFSPEGTTVTVRVESGEYPGRVRIAVRDQGKGIEADRLGKVFDRFHRGEEENAGTGLGLAICKEIVDLHGGRIWAESVPGQGSTFRAELPGIDEMRARAAREPDTGTIPRLSPRAAPGARTLRGGRDFSTTGTLPRLRR